MDRLLRYFLGQFIRRGTMNFTAASGTKFTCGDGTGRPGFGAVPHRTDPNAVSSSIPNWRSARPIWTARSWSRTARSRTRWKSCSDQPEMLPRWAKLQWWLRYFSRHARQFNLARPGEKQCRPSLRSRRAALFPLPRRRQAIQLRLFRNAGCDARRCPARQETPHRRQAPDRARRPRARYRLGLGRPWPLSGRNDRRRCYRHHAVDQSNCRSSNARAAEKNLTGSAKFLLERLSRYCRPVRSDRVGRHVRTCRRRLL